MARDFGPFPSKPMYEVVNRRMQRALAEATVSTGFAKPGQGAITAGTGAQLRIAAYPGGALVDGLWVENPDPETVTLTTNTESTNPRIDRLVMRLDMAAETIAPFQIVGTPAASPQAPPLVQNSAGYDPLTATTYDMPLCQYRFPGSASAQNPGSIVQESYTASMGTWANVYTSGTNYYFPVTSTTFDLIQGGGPYVTAVIPVGRTLVIEWSCPLVDVPSGATAQVMIDAAGSDDDVGQWSNTNSGVSGQRGQLKAHVPGTGAAVTYSVKALKAGSGTPVLSSTNISTMKIRTRVE